ncbi:23S rRNA (adenine(2030)-N(6))-methyltransferase RlmJ [Amphritea sp. 1_MG-2023]|uniref:23S rRNA (adenine(2030)-N(6))-methyltransferase RlmJ n=1 Tax=Amphritea sp. 1_MG-2023 TaxID=3062670 RepID=UPI0026E17675|nr:23S rRNA (adenine(2030)-N(6))-methyltransferase RlmJ [Amphritea sp. 1_MG-2023]MDO6562049.1 23S rRNA (adenine(2030)-N(6))-methyltransferase RlmJ [Amphritea sp. 1_MG-2023]
MLSYRHSFHAGNFADLLKHIVLTEILEHLIKKDKPFDYIDTHAGAGLYDLQSEHAEKLGEYSNGIAKLKPQDWPSLARYFAAIDACNPNDQLRFYPGSPLIANYFMRPQDKATLYELHPTDFNLLSKNTRTNRRIKVLNQDSLTGLLSLLPPTSRRALILMDPSYEMKSDYDQVFKIIKNAHKKFATGTYALWYPVVERHRIRKLEKLFINSGIRNIQRFELGLEADSAEHGMTSSGMIVINPPWTLFQQMQTLLPKLASTLDAGKGAFSRCDLLVPE